jgi:hypothetical protein
LHMKFAAEPLATVTGSDDKKVAARPGNNI